MSRVRVLLTALCVAPLMVLGLGCYETEYPLGSTDKASVDVAYVGDYAFSDDKKVSTIVIRNIDGKFYYVEWIDHPGADPGRMIGYTADVNGVTFANLRNLTDDGSIDKKFLVMRVGLSPDHAKLSLRNLKEDFIKGKGVNSSDDLEKIIAANMDNPQMYDDEGIVATRVSKPGATANPPGL